MEGARDRGPALAGLSARAAARLAWSLWALSVTLTGLSLALVALTLSSSNVHVFDWVLSNALVVIDVTVGAIVASRRPENPVGWLLCLFGVAVGTSSFTAQYAVYALLAQPGSLPAGEAAAWIAAWQLPIIIGLQNFYILLFPTGRLPGVHWRWLAWLIATFVLVGVILSAFSTGAYLGSLGPIRNPLGVDGFTSAFKALLYAMAPLMYLAIALAVIMRLRRAVGVERQQIKWFAYAAAIFAIGTILNVLALAIDAPLWFERAAVAVFLASGSAVPISIGIAILRYRLYDIDLLINRTLVYGSLTAALVVVYFGGVATTQTVFRALTGQEQQPQIAVVVSTLVIAALFNPLRRHIQGFIDRRLYRTRYDARKTLEAFSANLRDEPNLDALRGQLVTVVYDTMQPAHASLWLRPDSTSSSDGPSL